MRKNPLKRFNVLAVVSSVILAGMLQLQADDAPDLRGPMKFHKVNDTTKEVNEEASVRTIAFQRQEAELSIRLSKPTYRVGENLELELRATKPCFVRVVHVGSDGSRTQLLPNRFQPNNFLDSNANLVLPDAKKSTEPYSLRTHPPAGKETILVYVSPGKFEDSLAAAPKDVIFPVLSSAAHGIRGQIQIQAVSESGQRAEVVAATVSYKLVD